MATIVCTVLLSGIILGGCGSTGKHPSIDEGMAAVEALDYNTALQCFEKAMVDGENLRLLYRGQGLAYMDSPSMKVRQRLLRKRLEPETDRLMIWIMISIIIWQRLIIRWDRQKKELRRTIPF